MNIVIRSLAILAVVLAAFLSGPASEACHRSVSCCWYPCCAWPCCPPDTTPLGPIPHPGNPVNGTSLFLKNQTYSEAFAIIWLRYPDGIYRMYEKEPIKPGHTKKATQHYYQCDHVIIETWTRGTPTDRWHCRCNHLIVLHGLFNMFDVVHCVHTMPKTAEEAAAETASSATIAVSLPSDAKLTIDDAPTSSTSANRTFVTPPLPDGQSFSYTLKAQFVRNSEAVTMTKSITVRSGEVIDVSFADVGSVAAAK
jgi:uncharacterized protein (TIGR03000 family)